jgi:hypothetical protein
MYFQGTRTKRIRLALWMIPVALFVLFILFFSREVFKVIWFFLSIGLIILQFDINLDTSKEMIRALEMVGFNCLIGFGLVFFVWLGRIAAQALLPVSNFMESFRASWHLLLYILRLHGPAIFIKDGIQLSSADELKRLGPGVVVIDFNSAAVLEEQVPPPGILRPFKNITLKLLIFLGLSDPPAPTHVRTCGPGIVFTRRRERIRAAVDLRKQFRLKPKVSAYTRDGIEIKAMIWCIFTIGQDAEILQVLYDGERRPENLRIVKLERVPGTNRVRVTGFENTLDELDRQEIHHYARVADRLGNIEPFKMIETPDPLPVFNPDRVFSAAISEARNKDDELIPWYDLPTQVEADLFRSILSHANYNELYGVGESEDFPMPGFKRQLSNAMRNYSLLGYRLVLHRARITLRLNQEYEETDLEVSSPQILKNPKILRDRGIKIVASGFGEISLPAESPISVIIPKQRVDNWSASWQRDAEVVRASGELAANRVRAREQAMATQSLYGALSEILSNPKYSQEALALRVFQALENAAADAETRHLLPQQTLDMLKTIHNWLLPDESKTTKGM